MFSRASILPSTCLKCRTRQTGWNWGLEIRNVQHLSFSAYKWQGSAALQLQDDDPAPESTNGEIGRTDGNKTSPERDGVNEKPTRRKSQPRLKSNFRRWRPHNAQGLGVDVLGKPAEVLILPTRKQRSTAAAPEQNVPKEEVGLQKSLDTESQPVSMGEVLKNIDSLKADFGKGRTNFSAAEWRDCKKRLSDGFTKVQLEAYLRVAAGKSLSDPKDTYLPRNTHKRNLASKIMQDVWRWESHDWEETTSSAQPSRIKKSVSMDSAKLDYIMLHEKQRLATISETYEVQIDIFKQKSRIQMKGVAAAVDKVNKQLGTMSKNIFKSTLRLPRYLRDFLTPKPQTESNVAALMQKYKVLIQRDQDSLIVNGPTKTSADLISRDLTLLSARFCKDSPYSFSWVNGHEQPTTRVPFWLTDLPEWVHREQSWSRHVSNEAVDVTTDSKSSLREIRKSTSNILKSERPDRNYLSRYVIVPGSVNHEYNVELGQALFTSELSHQKMSKAPSEPRHHAEPVLVLLQPLLPQALAEKDFVATADPSLTKTKLRAKTRSPFLLRLRLRPTAGTPALPHFELILSGQDASLGLRQQLEIKRAHAIIDEWQHTVLMPDLPLDFLMSRQSSIDLLGNEIVKPSEAYLKLLRQFGTYLQQAQSSDGTELSPIWRLDVSPLLKTEGLPLQTRNNNPTSTSTDHTGKSSSNSPNSDGKNKSAYVLEPAEYLDVKSYTLGPEADRYIDHIVCETSSIDKPRQRQTLKISASSLSELLNGDAAANVRPKSTGNNTLERQKWFKDSITTAFDLVTLLSGVEGSVTRANTPANSPDSTS